MAGVAAARPDATSFELIEYQALREPGRLAVLAGTDQVSYDELRKFVLRFTRALAAAGVRRGQTVAIAQPGFLVELAVVLACENIGAATASFQSEGDSEAPTLFAMADWVVSEIAQPDAPAGRCILLDHAFAARLAALDPDDGTLSPRVAQEPHEPQRLSRTSGSTGKARWMRLNRQLQEIRIRRVAAEPGTYHPGTRLLLVQPFIVNGALTLALACLRMGAALMHPVPGQPVESLRPTHFFGLPATLARILADMPPGRAFDPPATVACVGGFLSQRLRREASRVMRGRVFTSYATTEVNMICSELDEHGEGWLAPGVEVRVVDEQGDDLPMGREGTLLMRTPGMVAGYIGHPAATALALRAGWYRSGDVGSLVAPRRLRVLGRHDDLVVIGGLKVPARQVEDQVCELLGVSAAAVAALPHEADADIGFAIVARPGLDLASATRRLLGGLSLPADARAKFTLVASLPRTANGKVDRIALASLFGKGRSVPAGAAQ